MWIPGHVPKSGFQLCDFVHALRAQILLFKGPMGYCVWTKPLWFLKHSMELALTPNTAQAM